MSLWQRYVLDRRSPPDPYSPSMHSRGSLTKRRSTTAVNEVHKGKPFYGLYAGRIIESRFVTALTMALTVYALTADDLRMLYTSKPSDEYFNVGTLVCIFVFTLEILLCVMGKDDYFLGFFFSLDVISTATLVFDLTWVSDAIQGDEDDMSNMRGSRTAKIGARASRVVRVIRLVRVVKLYKAFLEAQAAKRRRKRRAVRPDDEDNWDDIEVNQDKSGHRESRVGKKLSDLTTRRVIVLVLVMMLVQQSLRVDTSQQFPTSASYGADIIFEAYNRMAADPSDAKARSRYERLMLRYIYYHSWYTGHADNCPVEGQGCSKDYQSQVFWIGIMTTSESMLEEKARVAALDPATVAAWEQEIAEVNAKRPMMYNFGPMPEQVQTNLGMRWDARCNTGSGSFLRLGVSLLKEEIPGLVNYAVPCPEDLRQNERKPYAARLHVSASELKKWRLVFYFDTRPYTQDESMFSLLTVGFVCLALCGASVVFSHDANRLVLGPVENMIAKVETIRDNPLLAMKVADDEFKLEERKKAMDRLKDKNTKLKPLWRLRDMFLGGSNPANTEIMETVILEKTIIKLGSLLALGFGKAGAKIIAHNMNGHDSAAINAMVEGTRCECVIGSQRIKDFSTATEVLQANVMTFVNQIAEIVHGVVDEFHGYSSRNSGDHFLTIWRTSDLSEDLVSKHVDMSVCAVARILAALHRSSVLAAYRAHPGLQLRMGRHCRVHLSIGLHYGWTIEGAVGTEFKIDPSYLSPNVSLAESVERATAIYGVCNLISQSVVEMCTEGMAAKCRLIDRVIIGGMVEPLDLHVLDLDHLSLTVEAKYPHVWNSRQRFRCRQHLEADKMQKLKEGVKIYAKDFDEDPDIQKMRKRYGVEFVKIFEMGFQNYAEGEWTIAQRLLSRTRNMLGHEDGPSNALLKFMKTYDFVAPEGWQGKRKLSPAELELIA